MKNLGVIVFTARLDDLSEGIFRFVNGTIAAVARTGDSPLGGGTFDRFSGLSSTEGLVINDVGQDKGVKSLVVHSLPEALGGFPEKLGTGLFFVGLSRPASPVAGQRLADDPSELCLPRPLELTPFSLHSVTLDTPRPVRDT